MKYPFGTTPPTYTAEQVAEALRGHLSADDLIETARQLTKAVKRRNRTRKDSTHLSTLLSLVTEAGRPPAYTGDVEWFTQAVGGDPLEVVLMSGERIGDKATRVPAGASFVVPKLDDPLEPLYCRPAGAQGPDSVILNGARPGAVIKVTPELARASVEGLSVL